MSRQALTFRNTTPLADDLVIFATPRREDLSAAGFANTPRDGHRASQPRRS